MLLLTAVPSPISEQENLGLISIKNIIFNNSTNTHNSDQSSSANPSIIIPLNDHDYLVSNSIQVPSPISERENIVPICIEDVIFDNSINTDNVDQSSRANPNIIRPLLHNHDYFVSNSNNISDGNHQLGLPQCDSIAHNYLNDSPEKSFVCSTPKKRKGFLTQAGACEKTSTPRKKAVYKIHASDSFKRFDVLVETNLL